MFLYIKTHCEIFGIRTDTSMVSIVIFLLFTLLIINMISKTKYRIKSKKLTKDKLKLKSKIDKLEKGEKILLNEKNKIESEKKAIKEKYEKRLKIVEENRIKEKERFEKIIDDFKYENIFYKNTLVKTEIKASNTRLSAHFLKNILLKIYESQNQSNVLGFLKSSKQLTKDVIFKLHKLLDYNVSTLKKQNVDLNDEIEHIKIFLDIIKFLKPKVSISTKFPENTDFKITPTLFFPFIENVLKHGDLNSDDSFINIEVIIIKNILLYKVSNKVFDIPNKKIEKGFGLTSLEKALQTYYKSYELDYKLKDNIFEIELKIETK